MDWRTENGKDLQLLERRSLAPLDTNPLSGHDDLRATLGRHHARMAQAAARMRHLVEDRQPLGNFDAWQFADSADLANARRRVKRESWDALIELRRIVEERQAIMAQGVERLCADYHVFEERHTQVVAAAERRLADTRRELQTASPATAGSRFADLFAEVGDVLQAAQCVCAARIAFEDAATAKRELVADLGTITGRQREVFSFIVT